MNEKISLPDDKYVLELLSATLQLEGYQVIWADEGQKGSTRPRT